MAPLLHSPSALVLGLLLVAAPPAFGTWSSQFSTPPTGLGLDNLGHAAIEYDGQLHVAGRFHMAGTVSSTNIARFDGTTWTGGLRGGADDVILSLGVFGGSLYAGGEFLQVSMNSPVPVDASHVARWNGSSWSALGSGVSNDVYAFAEYAGDLVVAGTFLEAGGAPAFGVARWDGAQWSAMGPGLGGPSSTYVRDLASWNGQLYAGGGFHTIGGAAATGLARWDGAAWSDFGVSVVQGSNFFGGLVNALCVWNGGLVVGGNIQEINGVPINGVAFFDGVNWSDLGGGLDPGAAVRDLFVYHGRLVATGSVEMGPTFGIALFDGVSWSVPGNGLMTWDLFSDWIYGTEFQGSLYVTGNIGYADGIAQSRMARWTDAGTAAPVAVATGPGIRVIPNPARGEATIRFTTGRPSAVTLDIHDAAGRLVRRLAEGRATDGASECAWDGRDAAGRPVGSGVYFVRLQADGRPGAARLVIAR